MNMEFKNLEIQNFISKQMLDKRSLCNLQLKKYKKSIQSDLKLAKEVQKSWINIQTPPSPYWDVSCSITPFIEVSGDFFDFYKNGGVLRGVGLFDVSGHGISSALVTMMAKEIIHKVFKWGIEESVSLREVTALCDLALQLQLHRTEKYLTGILLRFNDKEVTYTNAGHPGLIYKSGNKVTYILNPEDKPPRGFFLGTGMSTSQFGVNVYEEIKFTMEIDEYLILYSDCLTESINKDGKEYTDAYLADCIRKLNGVSAEEMIKGIKKDFFNFMDTEPLRDDLTIMVIRRK